MRIANPYRSSEQNSASSHNHAQLSLNVLERDNALTVFAAVNILQYCIRWNHIEAALETCYLLKYYCYCCIVHIYMKYKIELDALKVKCSKTNESQFR